MGEYSVGEAINELMRKSGWGQKATEIRLQKEWEQIAGKTVAKYTRELKFNNGRLIIYTDVAALKQELNMAREQLLNNVNEYLGQTAVREVIIR